MHSTHIISALGLGVAVLAAGCGEAGDLPADQGKVAGKAVVRIPPVTDAANAAVAVPAELPAGRIAFRRYLDDAQTHGAVFTVKSDGTGEKQITDPPAGYADNQPDWSPDGDRIAFERCNDLSCEAFTVAADGGRPRKVPARCKLEPICDVGSPSWLPDGRIVVGIAQGRVRTRGESDQIQRFSVDLIDPARRTQRTIVKRTGWQGDTHTPAASPDGRSLVYMRWNSWRSKPAGGRALHVVRIDGSGRRRVTPGRSGPVTIPASRPTAPRSSSARSTGRRTASSPTSGPYTPTGAPSRGSRTSPRGRRCCRPPTRPTAPGSSTPPTASTATPTSS
jgi:Tol biopolymer transport system component